MKKTAWFGNLLLVFVAAIWGTAFVFQRVGMDKIEPITFNASRMTLSAIVVGIVVLVRGRSSDRAAEEGISLKRDIIGGVCCGVFLASASIFQQMGLVFTSAGKAGFITAMYMLLVPVIGFLFFKKRNPLIVWLAVALGVVGMYMLCITDGFSLEYGDSLVCVCALLFSGHILCCDHFAGRGDPIRISAIQFLTTAVISWTAAFIVESPTWAAIWEAFLPIAYCGIVSGGVGYTLQMVAQKHTDPTVASLLMSLESVFAVIAGALILEEMMSRREITGCAIMFAAIVIVQIGPYFVNKKSDVTHV
ncbi:MAG: DMT family transporter [Lachnospiraceae bacterium]|nr:DMT family transporter [Lachnospiraceae bacterium]